MSDEQQPQPEEQEQQVSAEIWFEVNTDDPEIAALVRDRNPLSIDVTPADVVEALENNDGLVLAFVWEMLERAGSEDLMMDLLDRLDETLEGGEDTGADLSPAS